MVLYLGLHLCNAYCSSLACFDNADYDVDGAAIIWPETAKVIFVQQRLSSFRPWWLLINGFCRMRAAYRQARDRTFFP